MKTTEYKLPADLIAELDAMPKSGRGVQLQWTPEMDAVLLEGWPRLDHKKFIRWFVQRYGRGSRATLERRYDILTQG